MTYTMRPDLARQRLNGSIGQKIQMTILYLTVVNSLELNTNALKKKKKRMTIQFSSMLSKRQKVSPRSEPDLGRI